jgi:hypothetical protein
MTASAKRLTSAAKKLTSAVRQRVEPINAVELHQPCLGATVSPRPAPRHARLRVALSTLVVAGGLMVTLSLWVKDQ